MNQTDERLSGGLVLIGAEKLWKQNILGKGIKISVIDSGIDADHPEFGDRIKAIKDFSTETTDGNDTVGHGTHVAGIIAASRNNEGMVGVAPLAELYIAKVFPEAEKNWDTVINAIEWSIEMGVDVINMSIGKSGSYTSKELEAAVKKAYDKGIILVGAAGNRGQNDGGRRNTILLPAALPEVWAVGAIDRKGEHAEFSGEGPQLDVVMPGTEIYSATKDGGYNYQTGTSMAAPFFSGVVALLINKFKLENGRKPTQLEMRGLVLRHCRDLGEVGLDESTGYGLFSFNHENKGVKVFLEDSLRKDK